MGLTDSAVEGTFVWIDGSAETYTESNLTEDCVVIRSEDGVFGDRACSSEFNFMCEATITPR